MQNQFRSLWEKYRSILIYLIFGVLTTAVNYLVYIPCLNLLGLPASVSNVIAWCVAVLFAFLTNKPFVFESKDWSVKTVVPEFTKFVGTRVASGLMETVILMVAVDMLGWNGVIWKLVPNVIVVILNYIGSKLLVFRRK